jgi:hypothetical protein
MTLAQIKSETKNCAPLIIFTFYGTLQRRIIARRPTLPRPSGALCPHGTETSVTRTPTKTVHKQITR